MIKIEDYILLPIEERKKHIDLSTKCIERGGNQFVSTYMRGILAHILDTTVPDVRSIQACHACK